MTDRDDEVSVIPGSGVKPSDVKAWAKLAPLIYILGGGSVVGGGAWQFDLFGAEEAKRANAATQAHIEALGVDLTRCHMEKQRADARVISLFNELTGLSIASGATLPPGLSTSSGSTAEPSSE